MELRSLQHLTALCEHKHFGRAAAALGISQPALSKSIQRLEKSLGAPLLDRDRKGVYPTAVGKQVVLRARAIVDGWAEVRREVDLMCGVEIGQLCVGVGPAMSESFVTTAIARTAEAHPKARSGARVDHWSRLSEAQRRGESDLYVADVSHVERSDEFRVTPLPPEEFVWFCRSGHPLLNARSVTRGALLDYPIVTPKMPVWARRWLADAADRGETLDSDHNFAAVECESYAMLKRMVIASDCVSAALRSTIRSEVEQGSLVALTIKAPALTTHAGIVSLSGRTLSPLAEAFVEQLVRCAEPPPAASPA